MVVPGTEEKYVNYIKQKDSRWEFGNSVLYKMCDEYPLHDDQDVIVGKIWLIGRSYAAAIERRKNANEYQGDDFYYDIVAPSLLKNGKELDRRLNSLKNNNDKIENCIFDVLSTHKFLTDILSEITGLEKRSLASKYLHFHCPDKFFIYDSRANNSIRKIVKEPDTSIIPDKLQIDEEYGDFVCRMLELQTYLKSKKITSGITPRGMDNYLLLSEK